MTMMVTNASHNDVVMALSSTVELMGLTTMSIDPKEGRIELHRGINFWIWGDDI